MSQTLENTEPKRDSITPTGGVMDDIRRRIALDMVYYLHELEICGPSVALGMIKKINELCQDE